MNVSNSIPFIFLVTDGSVEDEREICSIVKRHIADAERSSPRLCTFGIGSPDNLVIDLLLYPFTNISYSSR